MDLEKIKVHWAKLATEFKTDLKATTHTDTIKKLEIHAIFRAISRAGIDTARRADILEVGCGNGYNCFALAQLLPQFYFTGVDYVSKMIENAQKLQLNNSEVTSRIDFRVGDVLRLTDNKEIKDQYDIVFTDRCLINLNTTTLQLDALDRRWSQ